MKQYETRTTTYTTEVCIKQTCDLCGADAGSTEGLEIDHDWNDANEAEATVRYQHKPKVFRFEKDFAAQEEFVTVKANWGYNSPYPDGGGNGYEIEVDLCVRCFLERLVPWLESQGAKVEKKEWDW